MIKSRHRWAFPGFRSALKGEQGLNLVEVLIALAILAAVAGVFLVATATSSKAVMVGQQQVSAEGLAKSQMESIQQQNYSVDGVSYTKLSQSQIPTGYDIQFTVVRLNPQKDLTGNDQGLQKITVTVTHGGNTIFTLQGYKCKTGQ
jgi:prepilin-type N-terminal cleavage/methylation domain-containing protein